MIKKIRQKKSLGILTSSTTKTASIPLSPPIEVRHPRKKKENKHLRLAKTKNPKQDAGFPCSVLHPASRPSRTNTIVLVFDIVIIVVVVFVFMISPSKTSHTLSLLLDIEA